MKNYWAEFETNPHDLHTLKDVMNYTESNPDEKATEYGMATWERAETFSLESPRGSPAYLASQERRRHMGLQIPSLLDASNCDLLVVTGATSTTAEVGGCPCLSVPLGRFPDDYPIEKTKIGHVSEGPNIPYV